MVIMVKLLEKEDDFQLPEVASFKDVPPSHWAFEWVEKGKAYGITSGIGNGLFGLGQSVDHQQASAFMLNALNASYTYNQVITEAASLSIGSGQKIEDFRRKDVFDLLKDTLLQKPNESEVMLIDTLQTLDVEAVNQFKEKLGLVKAYEMGSFETKSIWTADELQGALQNGHTINLYYHYDDLSFEEVIQAYDEGFKNKINSEINSIIFQVKDTLPESLMGLEDQYEFMYEDQYGLMFKVNNVITTADPDAVTIVDSFDDIPGSLGLNRITTRPLQKEVFMLVYDIISENGGIDRADYEEVLTALSKQEKLKFLTEDQDVYKLDIHTLDKESGHIQAYHNEKEVLWRLYNLEKANNGWFYLYLMEVMDNNYEVPMVLAVQTENQMAIDGMMVQKNVSGMIQLDN